MKNIILQGLPGVGKTTLVKKIVEKLMEMKIEINGFYTEELRDDRNCRVGFDIITLANNKRAPLARKSLPNDGKFRVGTYSVQVVEFENLVMPIFDNVKSILIIDEIGRMEMFSEKFQVAVNNVIFDNNVKIIATVPLKSKVPLITQIKEDPNCTLFTVNRVNRNKLFDEILTIIIKN